MERAYIPMSVWLFRPIRGHARCAGHPRFCTCKSTRSRPVEHPDQWSRQERRFLRSSLRQWRLAVLGLVAVPSALLIRPDGYVAWASNDGLAEGTAMSSDTKTAVA
jgi:hypothetical protein